MLSPAPRPAGQGLLECLAVLAIVAVLASLVLPPAGEMLNSLRADSLRMTLHTSLVRARNEAVTRRELIGVCASVDGLQCTSDWNQGWMMYRSGARRGPPPSASAVLSHHPGSSTVSLSAHSSTGRPLLFFQADGRSPGANVTLRICHRGRLHGEVVVNNGGRARSSRVLDPIPC